MAQQIGISLIYICRSMINHEPHNTEGVESLQESTWIYIYIHAVLSSVPNVHTYVYSTIMLLIFVHYNNIWYLVPAQVR